MICDPCGRQDHKACRYPSTCPCQHKPSPYPPPADETPDTP